MRSLEIAIVQYEISEGYTPEIAATNQLLAEQDELSGRSSYWKAEDCTDPWGNPFCYVGAATPRVAPRLYSYGRDGISVTNGNDPDDINSWGQHGQFYYKEKRRREALRWGAVFLSLFTGMLILESLYKREFPEA